jgi:Effector protein
LSDPIRINPAAVDWVKTTYRSRKEYEAAVRRVLSNIGSVQGGRILLDSIRQEAAKHNVPLVIMPFDAAQDRCNADVVSVDSRNGSTGAIVEYSPDMWNRRTSACARFLSDNTKNRAQLPDEVLFHELVHGLRTVAQIYKMPKLSGGLYRYDNFEEFCAVLATNIYISDRTKRVKSGLRADHDTGNNLDPRLAGSVQFFQSAGNTFYWVSRFCTENPVFTKAMAEVKADFNPLWAYYHEPDKARKMSSMPLAGQRDSAGFGREAKDYEQRFFTDLAKKRHPSAP